MRNNQGFTLIELMVTIAILAILAAVAYASYTRYIVRNAEAQVEARMQSLAMELDRYRSSRLTFKGFVPKSVASNGTESFAYDSGNSVYSNDSNNKYVITITGSDNKALNDASSGGGDWVMLATPASTAMKEIKYKYFFSSTGQRCRSYGSGFDIKTDCTGAGVEAW